MDLVTMVLDGTSLSPAFDQRMDRNTDYVYIVGRFLDLFRLRPLTILYCLLDDAEYL